MQKINYSYSKSVEHHFSNMYWTILILCSFTGGWYLIWGLSRQFPLHLSLLLHYTFIHSSLLSVLLTSYLNYLQFREWGQTQQISMSFLPFHLLSKLEHSSKISWAQKPHTAKIRTPYTRQADAYTLYYSGIQLDRLSYGAICHTYTPKHLSKMVIIIFYSLNTYTIYKLRFFNLFCHLM